jgi:hypothetical protein
MHAAAVMSVAAEGSEGQAITSVRIEVDRRRRVVDLRIPR